jgi:predicted dehydrogenase
LSGGKWRAGIVGLGAAARAIHLPAFRATGRIEVVGGVDPVRRDVDGGFPLFVSLRELVQATAPDLVAIATPPESHFELVCEALEAGAHVFCEKPFVLTLDQAQQVIDLSSARGRHVVVNNEFRFMNTHEAARECIGSPEFGDLLFVSMHQTFVTTETTEAGWRGEGDRRTCFEFGTHALDLCRHFFGCDPWAISARMPRPLRSGGPDHLNLIQLDFPGDRVAHITLDRLTRGRHRYLDTRLDGTRATIETSLGGRAELALGVHGGSRRPFARLDLAAGGQATLFIGERRRVLATDPLALFSHATAKLLGTLLDALESGGTPPCVAEDNVATLALMLGAYRSADAGGVRIEMEALRAATAPRAPVAAENGL